MTRHEIQHGDGIKDYVKNLYSGAKSYATSAATTAKNYMNSNQSLGSRVVGSIGESAGAKIGKKLGEKIGDKITVGKVLSGVKTGLKHADSIKTGIDLVGTSVNTGLQIAKNAEDYKRSRQQTLANEKLDDEFFRQLRVKSDELRTGRGVKGSVSRRRL